MKISISDHLILTIDNMLDIPMYNAQVFTRNVKKTTFKVSNMPMLLVKVVFNNSTSLKKHS